MSFTTAEAAAGVFRVVVGDSIQVLDEGTAAIAGVFCAAALGSVFFDVGTGEATAAGVCGAAFGDSVRVFGEGGGAFGEGGIAVAARGFRAAAAASGSVFFVVAAGLFVRTAAADGSKRVGDWGANVVAGVFRTAAAGDFVFFAVAAAGLFRTAAAAGISEVLDAGRAVAFRAVGDLGAPGNGDAIMAVNAVAMGDGGGGDFGTGWDASTILSPLLVTAAGGVAFRTGDDWNNDSGTFRGSGAPAAAAMDGASVLNDNAGVAVAGGGDNIGTSNGETFVAAADGCGDTTLDAGDRSLATATTRAGDEKVGGAGSFAAGGAAAGDTTGCCCCRSTCDGFAASSGL